MNPTLLLTIREAARLWRKNHTDHASRGKVMVSTHQTSGMAFAFGWNVDEPIACHFARGIYAVAVDGTVTVAAGGKAGSADRWDLLHEDVIRPREDAPFLLPASHPPLASQRFQAFVATPSPLHG